MYLPDHFSETRADVLRALIKQHRLATIVRNGPDGLVADHIPLMFDDTTGHPTLRGHVARANPLWREAAEQEVLAIFQGPQAYISPSWYASKAEHDKVVPTWNYVVVHARGRLAAIDDAEWLRAHLSSMTNANESRFTPPWKVADAPDDFIRATARAIVGVEIKVKSLTGKWKISQNRSATDRSGVTQGLDADAAPGAAGMAALMRSTA